MPIRSCTVRKWREKKCHVLFSPNYEQYSPTVLAEQILADNLSVRLQIQLHKYLWGDAVGK